jgi:hypothetical protein
MRESVRHYKSVFYQTMDEKNKKLLLLLNYQGKEMPELDPINKSICALLDVISNEIK